MCRLALAELPDHSKTARSPASHEVLHAPFDDFQAWLQGFQEVDPLHAPNNPSNEPLTNSSPSKPLALPTSPIKPQRTGSDDSSVADGKTIPYAGAKVPLTVALVRNVNGASKSATLTLPAACLTLALLFSFARASLNTGACARVANLLVLAACLLACLQHEWRQVRGPSPHPCCCGPLPAARLLVHCLSCLQALAWQTGLAGDGFAAPW